MSDTARPKWLVFVCAGVACAGLFVSNFQGQVLGDEPPGAQPASETPPERSAVHDVALAIDLIELGRRQKLPEAIVSAALILHRAGATPGTDKLAKGNSSDDLPAATALLDEAKAMRTDDKAVAEIVARAKDELQEISRGASTGPKYYAISVTKEKPFSRQLRLNGKSAFTCGFSSGVGLPPWITVGIRDAKGQWVSSQSGWRTASVSFTPPETADYTVFVFTGNYAASGYLMHN